MISATYFGHTDPGRVRTNNEDTYFVEHVCGGRYILAMAIDGVGGYEGGEVAAAMARDTIVAWYQDEVPQGKLCHAVVEANNKIYQRRRHDAVHSQMGCVLTAALIDLEQMKIEMAHVGDTRLYQFGSGGLAKLSHDHSLVGYREEIGELTEEEAMNHPNRNIISKAVGAELLVPNSDYVEYAELPVVHGTTLLFCSDGLYDMITSRVMTEVLASDLSLEDKVHQLIARANAAGGHDNVTVVLVAFAPEAEGKVIIEADDSTEASPVVVEASPVRRTNGLQVVFWILLIMKTLILLSIGLGYI